MILGIGNDLADIRRIQKTLDRFGNRFLERIFTKSEVAKAMKRADPAATLAEAVAIIEAVQL